MFQTLDRMKVCELPMLNADGIHRRVLDEVLDDHASLKLLVSERDELNQILHRMRT
jgi:hypothetical protein